MRSLAFQLQQQLPPRIERPPPLLEVIMPVVDTFHALELVVQATLGHVRLHAQGGRVGAGGAAEVVHREVGQAVLHLAHRTAQGRLADVRHHAALQLARGQHALGVAGQLLQLLQPFHGHGRQRDVQRLAGLGADAGQVPHRRVGSQLELVPACGDQLAPTCRFGTASSNSSFTVSSFCTLKPLAWRIASNSVTSSSRDSARSRASSLPPASARSKAADGLKRTRCRLIA